MALVPSSLEGSALMGKFISRSAIIIAPRTSVNAIVFVGWGIFFCAILDGASDVLPTEGREIPGYLSHASRARDGRQ